MRNVLSLLAHAVSEGKRREDTASLRQSRNEVSAMSHSKPLTSPTGFAHALPRCRIAALGVCVLAAASVGATDPEPSPLAGDLAVAALVTGGTLALAWGEKNAYQT